MPKTTSDSDASKAKTGRPFLGVQFECCGVYSRIYRNLDELMYEGRCPKCRRLLTVKVDPQSGVSNRFFRAR